MKRLIYFLCILSFHTNNIFYNFIKYEKNVFTELNGVYIQCSSNNTNLLFNLLISQNVIYIPHKINTTYNPTKYLNCHNLSEHLRTLSENKFIIFLEDINYENLKDIHEYIFCMLAEQSYLYNMFVVIAHTSNCTIANHILSFNEGQKFHKLFI